MSPPPTLSSEQVIEHLRRADLDPNEWDLVAITARVNAWIADNHAELVDPDVKTWSPQLQADHFNEFGELGAVDFFEQCVIETWSDCAPWLELQDRVDAGEFAQWPPIWEAAPRCYGYPPRA